MGKVNKKELPNKKVDNSKKLKSIEKVKKSKLPTTEKANSPDKRVKTTNKVTKKNGTRTTQKEREGLSITPTKSSIVVGLNALFEVVEKTKNSGENKELFEDDKIRLQFNNIKIPKCPTRTARILLPHSTLPEAAEVCFIVPDLKRGRKVDPEPTIHHYEDLLRKAGVEKMPTILPLNKLRTEYNQFELKRRLVTQYDTFLVDGRISGYVFHLLGSVFIKRNKYAFPVRTNGKDLKRDIDQCLHRVSIELSSVGNSRSIEIGNLKMDKEDIADNVLAAMEWLTKNYPGGWENIRNVLIKTITSMSIPLYWSFKDKNEVNIPVVLSKKRKSKKTVEGELSTIPGAKVTISSDGTVKVKKPRTPKPKKVEQKEEDIKKDDIEEDSENESEDESEEESENESEDETNDVKIKQEVKTEDADDDSDAELEDAEDNYLQSYGKEQLEINNKTVEERNGNQKQQNLKNKNKNKSPKKGKNNKNKANKIAGTIKTESKDNSSQLVSPAKKGGNNVPKVRTTPSPKAKNNKKGVKRLQ